MSNFPSCTFSKSFYQLYSLKENLFQAEEFWLEKNKWNDLRTIVFHLGDPINEKGLNFLLRGIEL